jgi:epoxyqueuosine reductase
VARPAETDGLAEFEVSPDFERFDQMNDMFTRAFWDETVRSADTDAFFAGYRMDAEPRRGEGFSQKDFALRNAAWLISDIISNRGPLRASVRAFRPSSTMTRLWSQSRLI